MKFKRDILDNLCLNITDGEHASVQNDEYGNYFLLSNKNIINGQIVITKNERKISKETFNKINKRTKLEKGDLVISTVGILGKLAIINDDFLNYDFQRSVGMIKCDENKINTQYLYHYLNTDFVQLRLNHLSKGAVQKCLFISDLKKLEIDFPSISYQQKIAKVLSDLDAKIELNNKINAELEEMAKTLYDYWFVQFDFPDANGKPYKSSGGKMVWNEELKREIPEGWEVNKIKKILKTELGGTPSTAIAEFWNGNIPWLNSGEIANFPIISSEASISKKAIENSATSLMPKGTIVLSITRHIRPSILAIDACANQSVVGIYQSDKIKSSFLYPFIQNEVPRYMTLRTGAQQPHINKQTIDSTLIVIPNEKVLKKYYERADVIYDKIINNAFQNQELALLRYWLLPMLMNGQVSVGEAESDYEKKKRKLNELVEKFKAEDKSNSDLELVAKEYRIKEEVLGMVAEPRVINLTPQYKKVRRKMLATFIVNQSLSDTSFGKTKFEKLLHLVEYHLVKNDFNQRYSVQTAGPYDGGFTKVFWDEVTAAKWFKFEELGNLKRVVAGENHEKSLKEYDFFSEELKQSIRDFITLFNNTNYEKAEIVSTLYAVWNNRLIKNEFINDNLLKNDFVAWDIQKARYTDQLDAALVWMRKENIVPDGWGKYISRAKSK